MTAPADETGTGEACACGHDETDHGNAVGCIHCGNCDEYIPRSAYHPSRERGPGRAIAASQIECDVAEVLHTHDAVTWTDALELAEDLLSGPVAPLLEKLRRVEALADEMAVPPHAANPLTPRLEAARRIRRALDGTGQ